MMIDGIKLEAKIDDLCSWFEQVGFEFTTEVNVSTGENCTRRLVGFREQTVTIYKAKFRDYTLTVKHVEDKIGGEVALKNYLTVTGSLHKSFYDGSNWRRFYWSQLQNEVSRLAHALHLDLCKIKISNLEIGVNLIVDFNVSDFLNKYLVFYKTKSFEKYYKDNADRSIGYFVKCAHYIAKVYSKGLQYNLPYELMRFEVKFKKMQKLNKMGIHYLSDLSNKKLVDVLVNILSEVWDNILLSAELVCDRLIPKSCLQLLHDGSQTRYWEELRDRCKKNFFKQRDRFSNAIYRYGKCKKPELKVAIQDEWAVLSSQ